MNFLKKFPVQVAAFARGSKWMEAYNTMQGLRHQLRRAPVASGLDRFRALCSTTLGEMGWEVSFVPCTGSARGDSRVQQ